MNTALRYTIVVLSPAYGTQNARLAFQFCEALLQRKQIIHSLFFYMDGVHNANSLSDPANDEFDLVEAWQKLARLHNFELNVCYSASRRRGITEVNFASHFLPSGLIGLSEAIVKSDRLIQF